MSKVEKVIAFERTINKDRALYESKELRNLLLCRQCQNIPVSPLKELNSNQIFCTGCYNSIKENVPLNIQNNQNTLVFKPLNIFEIISFSKIKIKCKNSLCKKKFSYLNLLNLFEHENSCLFNEFAIKPKAIVTEGNCEDCHGLMGPNHNCIKNLSEKIEKLNNEFFQINENFSENEKDNLLKKKRNNSMKLVISFGSTKKNHGSAQKIQQETQNLKITDFNRQDENGSTFSFKDKKEVVVENQITKIEPRFKKTSFIMTPVVFKKISDLIFLKALPFHSLSLIFKASENNFSAEKFHQICDGLSAPTLIVVKDTEGNVFGGYSTISWRKECNYRFLQYDRKKRNFLFSLRNNCIYPVKTVSNAVTFSKLNGPSFGKDLCISDFCDKNNTSSSFLGSSYESKPEVKSLTNENYFKVIEY